MEILQISFFTVRNNGTEVIISIIKIDVIDLGISEKIAAAEMVSGKEIKTEDNKLIISIQGGRTQAFQVKKTNAKIICLPDMLFNKKFKYILK